MKTSLRVLVACVYLRNGRVMLSGTVLAERMKAGLFAVSNLESDLLLIPISNLVFKSKPDDSNEILVQIYPFLFLQKRENVNRMSSCVTITNA